MKRFVKWWAVIATLLIGTYVAAEIIQGKTAGGVAKSVLVETSGAVDVVSSAGTGTGAPGYTRVQDGDSTVLQDVEDSQADGVATTLNGAVVNARLFAYNGTSMDMLRVNGSKELVTMPNPHIFDDDNAANCADITAASQQFTAVASTYYEICAYGNSAYILGGSNPTATTTVTTGYSAIVPEGACVSKFKPASAKIAWIGASAAGVICFKAYTSP